MKCVYCLENKPQEDFTKGEHVLPRSFGTFENNFVLTNAVCDSCNQYFGNELEIHLARDTFEGSLRVENKIQREDDFKSPGKKSRMKLRLDEGRLKGALAYRDLCTETGKVALYPQPQIGFLKNNAHEFFHIDELPDHAYLAENDFEIHKPEGIIILGCELALASEKLKEKQIPHSDFKKLESDFEPDDTVGCTVNGVIDGPILRAIAKIAFNYATYWHGTEFMHQKDFDPIRKYILYGTKASYDMIHMDTNPILGDEPIEGKRRSGHLVTLNMADDKVSILSKISLMNWATYYVCLACEYQGITKNIAKGHFFDFPNRRILDLTTKSPY